MARFMTQPAPVQSDEKWRAQGFLNISVPTEDGKTRQLGQSGIGLRLSVENEKKIADWLEKNPANIAKLKDLLIIEYRPATPGRGATVKLPD